MAAPMRKYGFLGFKRLIKYKRELFVRKCSNIPESEYVEVPQYAPIRDHGKEGEELHQRQMWYDYIQSLPTVEQKLTELATYERRFVTLVNPQFDLYNDLPSQQFYTRTRLITHLPENVQKSEILDEDFDQVKDHFLENFKFEYGNMKNENGSKSVIYEQGGRIAFHQAISTIMSSMSRQYGHLLRAQVDEEPRCESFWWKSEIYSDKRKRRKDKEFIDVCFQYNNKPSHLIRTDEPLSPVVPLDDPLCKYSVEHVPNYQYHPNYHGYWYDNQYVTSIPGIWPGGAFKYPLLSMHTTKGLADQYLIGEDDKEDRLNGFGIVTSFGLLMGVATHLGFTPFHELTYPLVTQTVVGNGQEWSFFIYQLNTICLHSDTDKKLRQNLCWSSGSMKLFDTIEDNEIKGLNDEVFKILYKFFINRPYCTLGMDVAPHLSEDTQTEEEKEITRKHLRFMYDNRITLHQKKLEIPLWKMIYKLHPKARPSPWLK